MDPSLSPAAAMLLDFIASFESSESSRGYETIFGNHQDRLSKKITSMTLDELLANQVQWGRQFGSSAAGRYQFMPNTLRTLMPELRLTGREVFSPALQDRLGYRLLRRRGFDGFISKMLSIDGFGLGLAQEWASLPVLKDTRGAKRAVARGQSYYAGVFSNKAGVSPERVETVLREVLALPNQSTVPSKTPEVVMANSTPASLPTIPADGDFAPKPWYLSKGVIGGLIAVAVPIASIFFPAARVIDPVTATDWVMKIVAIAGPVIGGSIAVLGRIQATQPISGTKAVRTFLNAGLGSADGTPLAGFNPSMMDMPLSAIAADLPQVLLMLHNAGQLVTAAADGHVAREQPFVSDAGGHDVAKPSNDDHAVFVPDDPQNLTVAHLQALSVLATKLADFAPTLSTLFPSQTPAVNRPQAVPTPKGSSQAG